MLEKSTRLPSYAFKNIVKPRLLFRDTSKSRFKANSSATEEAKIKSFLRNENPSEAIHGTQLNRPIRRTIKLSRPD